MISLFSVSYQAWESLGMGGDINIYVAFGVTLYRNKELWGGGLV